VPSPTPAAERDLVRGESGRTAEAHAPLLGRFAPRAGAAQDQRPFELGDAGEHGQHHAARGRRRVRPRLGQAAQPGIRVPQPLGDVEQVACRAGQPIEAGDHDHILRAHVVEQPVQLRPVAPRPGHLLRVGSPAARLTKRLALEGEALVISGHASVAK